jgi:hypothetical protein
VKTTLEAARATSWPILKLLPADARVVLTAVGAVWFGILVLSAFATPFPIVMSDEAGHLLPTLLGSGRENYHLWESLPRYPDYLYYAIYRALSVGDPEKAAKVVNAAFIVATALPAYATARHFLSQRLSLAFALLVVVAPVSSFVRYVMPEAFYLFGFWVCIWTFVATSRRSPYICAVALAVGFAAVSLIKPHALALTVGLMAFFVFRERFAPRGFVLAIIHSALFYAVRLLFSRLLTGEWITSLSGSDYAEVIGRWPNLAAGAQNLSGHVCAIVLLIGVPLAVALVEVGKQWWRPQPVPANGLFDLGLLACCLFAAMLAMAVFFAQAAYQLDPIDQRATRLSGRYYMYVLPLFPLYALAAWQSGQISEGLVRPLATCLFLAMPIAAIVAVFLFDLSPVDFAELSLLSYRRAFYLAIVFPLIAAIPWLISRYSDVPVLKIAVGWWAALSLTTTLLLVIAYPLVAQPRPVDQAMMQDSAGLRKMAIERRGVIYCSPAEAAEMYRLMFYLRSSSPGRVVAAGTAIDDSMIPPEFAWAVFMFDVRYTGRGQVVRMGPLTVLTRR